VKEEGKGEREESGGERMNEKRRGKESKRQQNTTSLLDIFYPIHLVRYFFVGMHTFELGDDRGQFSSYLNFYPVFFHVFSFIYIP